MASRTQVSNGSIRDHSSRRSTTTSITTKLGTLVTTVSLKRSTDSPQMTRVSSHSHGGELRKLTQLMDSRTQNSNGSIRDPSLRRSTSTTTNTITKQWILVTMESPKKFTDSLQTTKASCLNHGEESRRPTQRMASRTHLSNGSTET